MVDFMINDEIKALVQGKNFATISTLLPNGQIQTHVVWVDCDDDHIVINTEAAPAPIRPSRPPSEIPYTAPRSCADVLARRHAGRTRSCDGSSAPTVDRLSYEHGCCAASGGGAGC